MCLVKLNIGKLITKPHLLSMSTVYTALEVRGDSNARVYRVASQVYWPE